MRRSRRGWIVLVPLALLILGLGGVVGWWLAMRAMPMDEMEAGRTRAGASGMAGMKGMPGMGGMAGAAAPGGTEPGPRGGAGVVQIDRVRLQRSGVTYAVARRGPLERRIRAEASVTYDEERRAEVTTKVGGWVERLYVDKPGQPVRRGQPLLELYSPDLVSTQRELVLALEHARLSEERSEPGGAEPPRGHEAGDAGLSAQGLVEAARRRLELWSVPSSEIERLIRTREVRRSLTLVAPVGGVVVEKSVLQGARIEPGEELFQIADLSIVWVEARVFEMDLAHIRVGQAAKITLQAYPGETFTGKVGFIYPYLDPATRTVSVRLEVPNRGGRLKPGMFAAVIFESVGDRDALVVPASAVVETGERAFVLVKRGEGLFEPREVQVGERAGARVSVTENLAEGDTVVVSANFLIDSEANLMAYMGGMLGMGMRADQMRMDARGKETMEGMEGRP